MTKPIPITCLKHCSSEPCVWCERDALVTQLGEAKTLIRSLRFELTEAHNDPAYLECCDVRKKAETRVLALESELSGYKESHDKYCPSAARVQALEAALRWLGTAVRVTYPTFDNSVTTAWQPMLTTRKEWARSIPAEHKQIIETAFAAETKGEQDGN